MKDTPTAVHVGQASSLTLEFGHIELNSRRDFRLTPGREHDFCAQLHRGKLVRVRFWSPVPRLITRRTPGPWSRRSGAVCRWGT